MCQIYEIVFVWEKIKGSSPPDLFLQNVPLFQLLDNKLLSNMAAL